MRHIFLYFYIFLVISNALHAQALSKTKDLSSKEMQAQNITIAKMFAEEISKKLPSKIDNYTQLVKVNNEISTIIYTFEINTGSKSDAAVIAEDRTRMHDAIQNGVCKTSSRFLDANINISYLYISAHTKKKLFQFNITKQDCIF